VSDSKFESKPLLTADDIRAGLKALSDDLATNGILGEICLFGGAVMVLAFDARLSTKDVDAIFQPTEIIRESARKIAVEQGLREDWLNDGVKGFIGSQPELISGRLPQFPNLHIVMPIPEYMLAMKCMAGRIGGPETTDVPDIIFLIRHLSLKTPTQVLDVVSKFYDKSRIPVRTQYLVEGLFEEGQI
jgi:hypothetical protein